jgi:hypothetical protein
LNILGVLMTNKTNFSPAKIKVCPKGLNKLNTEYYILTTNRSLPTYQVGQCNLWLIKDLRACKSLYNCRVIFTDVMSALQIHLFMQNKPNFRKVKFNVNKVLIKDYDQMDTWSIRKNKPKTNPIQSQFKPNTKPIQTQYKAKQTQFHPRIRIPARRSLPQTDRGQGPIKEKSSYLYTCKAPSQLFSCSNALIPPMLRAAPAVKKFHLILVLHRRIMFNSGSNCEMEMGATFAKRSKTKARQAHKLTFLDPLETLTKLR